MYSTPSYISDPIGNNAFSYQERKKLGSTGKIYVPRLIQGTGADLQTASEICFEEVLNGEKISCSGIKNFVQLDYHGKQIFIVDNHNHALAFRYHHQPSEPSQPSKPFNLIHIDQHSDIKPNENTLAPNENIEDFVNTKTNVGNFIPAAINSGIINDVIQIRTDYALKSFSPFLPSTIPPFILDIDIDFREDKEITQNDIQILQKLISDAQLVTIATSPYFIDQEKAITIIKSILG